MRRNGGLGEHTPRCFRLPPSVLPPLQLEHPRSPRSWRPFFGGEKADWKFDDFFFGKLEKMIQWDGYRLDIEGLVKCSSYNWLDFESIALLHFLRPALGGKTTLDFGDTTVLCACKNRFPWPGPICGKTVQGSSSGGGGQVQSVDLLDVGEILHIIHILDSLVLSFYWIPTVRQRWFLLAQFPHPWLAVCELAVEMQQKAHAAMQNSPRRIRNFSSRLRIGTAPASKTWTFAQTHQRKTPAKHGDNEWSSHGRWWGLSDLQSSEHSLSCFLRPQVKMNLKLGNLTIVVEVCCMNTRNTLEVVLTPKLQWKKRHLQLLGFLRSYTKVMPANFGGHMKAINAAQFFF